MTIFGSLFRQETTNIENPATSLDAEFLASFGVVPTEAGVSVTQESAYRMLAVYRAIALFAGLVGAMPLHAYRKVDGRREQMSGTVLDDPHPDATPMEVWEYAAQSLLADGNSYQFKGRDGLGRIRELWPIAPQDVVKVERKKEWRSDTNPSGKRFTVQDGSEQKTYTPYEILHVPGLSYDGLKGLSPIGLARQSIGTALAAEQFAARMFGRGALIPGVLETSQKLEQDEADVLQKRWAHKTAGGANQWRIPVLSSGVQFKPIALPPADVQYLEIRRFGVQEIARLYGLPPHLLADVERSTSWGSGIEQQNLQLLTFTVDPFLVRIEQRATKELRPGGMSSYAKFNRGALLRADTASRYMAHQRAVSYAIANPDEVRELEEMPPMPNGAGQTFYRPGNLEPVPGTAPASATTEDDDEQDG